MKQTLKLVALLTACAMLLLVAGANGANAEGDTQGNSPLIGPRVVTVRSLPAASTAATPGLDTAVARRTVAIAQQPGPTAEAASGPPATTALSGAPPTVFSNSFDGADNTDNGNITGFTVTPPDAQLAAGPKNVVEFINIMGRIYDKKGNILQSFKLADFFGVPSGYQDTDPKIIYDALSGRWFATYVSYQNNPGTFTDFGRIHLAVSATDDPTGTWYHYYVAYNNLLPDYAAIGLSEDKVTLSSNVYDVDDKFLAPPCTDPFGYCGEQTIVVEKSQVMAGAASPATTTFPLDSNGFTVRPAHSLSSTSDQYLASFDATVAALPTTHLIVTKISGTPALGNVTRTVVASPTIQPQNDPPASQTAGGGTIDSGDFRLLETVYRDGTLWASAGTACTPDGDSAARSCLHVMQVDAASGALLQDIVYGSSGEYYSWPSIRTDPDGNLFVSLTHTNTSVFAEAATAARAAADPPNTLSPIVVLHPGTVVHTSGRWGDYLGAAVDPVTPACIWLVGEYAKSTSGADWGTYVASVGYSGCDSDSDGWATPADNCPSISNSAQADADSDGVGDPCDNCPQWANASQALPDWVVPVGDSDCDGYPDSVPSAPVTYRAGETVIGTVTSQHCAANSGTSNEPLPDAWPPDFNDNQLVNGADVLSFNQAFGHPTTDPPVNIGGTLIPLTRFDLNGSGLVNGSDVLQLNPFFSKRCDS